MKKSHSFLNVNEQLEKELADKFGHLPSTVETSKSGKVIKLKGDEKRSRSYSTNSHALDKPQSSSETEASDISQGKTIKLKGGHLKDNKTFAKLSLMQDLSNDGDLLQVPVDSSSSNLRRSGSLSSFSGQEDATNSAIWILRFSLDGFYLAAGRQDGAIIIWGIVNDGVAATEPEGALDIDEQSIADLKSPAPAIDIFSGSSLLFDQKPLRVFKGHSSSIADLSWSRGNFLVSGGLDGTARLWHISSENCLCIFQHSDFVTSVRFHPFDDNIFASGGFDGMIRVWDIRQKKLLYWNEVPKDSVSAICFSRDASTIIVGTFTGTCVFYDFTDLKYNTQIQVSSSKGLRNRDAKITGIEIMPHTSTNEEKVLITSVDSKIRLISVKDKSLFRTYKGLELKTGRCFASFSQNGNYIICGSDDKNVCIWDTFPQDANQQYSGVLSSVIHRHIDTAKASGQEKFLASEHPITCAMFAPSVLNGTASIQDECSSIIVANDHGNILVFCHQ